MKYALLLFLLLPSLLAAGPTGDLPAKYLLLDSRVIERTDNVRLAIGTVRKHPSNPLFGEDKPWEVRFDNLYANVIYDQQEKIYKCWYNPFIVDTSASETPKAKRATLPYVPTKKRESGECYATSKDGLKWEKPSLGLVEFEGSKANNLVARDVHGAGVFKDMVDRDAGRRYKMFYRGPAGMAVRFSPDGLTWSEETQCKDIAANGDSHNNAFWAADLKKYVGITRLKVPQRVVARTESEDFIHWTKAAEVYRIDPNNQAYAMPVFRYANVYLGLVMIYHIKPDDRVDVGLVWSPDTISWSAIDGGTPLIPLAERRSIYDWGCIYAAGNPVVLNDEIRIYYGASNGPHTGWRDGFLALATLRPDGWAGYTPLDAEKVGLVITKPIDRHGGGSLRISADIGKGSLRVAIVDAEGKTIAASNPMTNDVSDAIVTWPNPAVVAAEKTVRLRFELERAKLYSFSFTN